MTFDPRYLPQHPGPNPQNPQGPVYPGAGYNPAGPGMAYPNYYGPQPFGPQPPTSSGVGFASFIIGLIAGIALIIAVAAAGILTYQSGGRMDEKSPEAIGLGLVIFAGIGANLIGAILGIVNLSQANRKKLFGVLGLIFNGGMILLVVGLMVIGMAMK